MLERGGGKRSICWYVSPDLVGLDEGAVTLVKQYAWLHYSLTRV
ncbi:MAG: hypothetical protein AB1445_11425 [Bacillota bacterium]